MSVFPNYVEVIFEGYKESIPEPSVMRTEMERGPAFQEVRNKRVYRNITFTILFNRKQDIDAFDNWYNYDIKRAAFFTMKHPRRGVPIQARFPGGKLGDLIPVRSGFGLATRTLEVEYMP